MRMIPAFIWLKFWTIIESLVHPQILLVMSNCLREDLYFWPNGRNQSCLQLIRFSAILDTGMCHQVAFSVQNQISSATSSIIFDQATWDKDQNNQNIIWFLGDVLVSSATISVFVCLGRGLICPPTRLCFHLRWSFLSVGGGFEPHECLPVGSSWFKFWHTGGCPEDLLIHSGQKLSVKLMSVNLPQSKPKRTKILN